MKHLISIAAVGFLGLQQGNSAFAQASHAQASHAQASHAQASHAQASHAHDRARSTFGERRHVDTLADRLQREANTICWEMYNHYQHEQGYRETYREVYTALEDAIHIHDLAHDDAHRGTDHENHIVEDLHDMDRLFHHVVDDIRHWSSRNHYHRHDLAYRMERFESTLHHLMNDYGVRSKRPAPKPEGPGKPPVPSR